MTESAFPPDRLTRLSPPGLTGGSIAAGTDFGARAFLFMAESDVRSDPPVKPEDERIGLAGRRAFGR
jgi:hypothetical protein